MPVISVSQLNNYIKRYIDQNKHLTDLWIKGEISNYKQHYSGHIYFTLKDSESTLKAVMFQRYASNIKFAPKDGMKVIAFGKISVYESGGSYQLYVESMIPDGIGELYASYEQLKQQLEAQGLFSVEKKKIIPRFPRKIGIVSSISGAALRDVLNVISRRYPISHIIIYPAKVQGIGAADSICDGLNYFSENQVCDVIILARGGGTIEDLWAFNEEKTALAIYNCKTPVITGVGHETDYTISDFVADVRAPTPSAAAEIAVPDLIKLKETLSVIETKAYTNVYRCLENKSNILQKNNTEVVATNLNSQIELNKSIVEQTFIKIEAISASKLSCLTSTISTIKSEFEALNPKKVLKRGYTIVQTADGGIADFLILSHGDVVDILFDGGTAKCKIQEVLYDEK